MTQFKTMHQHELDWFICSFTRANNMLLSEDCFMLVGWMGVDLVPDGVLVSVGTNKCLLALLHLV